MKTNRILWIALLLSLALVAGCTWQSPSTGSYAASGVVKDEDETPIAGVVLQFSEGYGTSQTDTNGEWVKSGLRGAVTVTPAKEGYTFDPQSRVVTPTFAREVSFLGMPTSITVSPVNVVMQVDDEQVFEASGRDKYGQPVPVTPSWIVTGGIGTASPAVGETIVFTATTPGEGTVVAEDDDIAGYAIVTVLPRRAAYDIDVTHEIDSVPLRDIIGGQVTAVVDDTSYDYGAIVSLVATPDPGWHFLGWEGDIETGDEAIDLVVIDRAREPVDPFGIVAVPGGGYAIHWQWAGDPTYHPEIVAYGDSLAGLDGSREQAGDLLEAKFGLRSIRAVFEKDY